MNSTEKYISMFENTHSVSQALDLLVTLGKQAQLNTHIQQPANCLKGCQYRLWVAKTPAGITTHSDGVILRGLGVIIAAIANETKQPIVFKDIEIIANNLPYRSKRGLQIMINRVNYLLDANT